MFVGQKSPTRLKKFGQSSIGPVIGSEQDRNSGGKFMPAKDGNASLSSPQKFISKKDISFGFILKTQSENAPKGIVTENGLNKQNNGTNSTWASLFRTSSKGSLPSTLLKAIGDKVVVVPPKEVIAQGIWVWENSLIGQLIYAKMPYTVIYRIIEKIWGKNEMPLITIL